MISEWQDGNTLPDSPSLYRRQFSAVPDTLFDPAADTMYYHYFDGKDWYIWGDSEEDAMREFNRGNVDDDKYRHAPWRVIVA